MGIADAATRAMVDNRLVPADLMVFSHYVQPLFAAWGYRYLYKRQTRETTGRQVGYNDDLPSKGWALDGVNSYSVYPPPY